MFTGSEWIWCDSTFTKNERCNFFVDFNVENVPEKAILNIAAETKYRLFLNGRTVVFDGGLFRESRPGCGYYDTVDLSPYLKKGENGLVIQVWYYGNGGRNNSFCEKAGLIFACKELSLYSGNEVLSYSDDAYYLPESEPTSHLYGGDHTAYDARVRKFALPPSRVCAKPSVAVAHYGEAPFGELYKRPIPMLSFTDRIPCTPSVRGEKHVVALPYAMQVSPYFKVKANGGEVIDVRSDRFEVHGGPGDTAHVYRGHRIEYVCAEGEQEFEASDWIFGEELIFTVPSGVTVIELGYRESSYPTEITTSFECDDEALNKLFKKCLRTLKVCMRENYMDCPDRERGQWIGDVSVQAPQIIYTLDRNGLLLLRKAICDFINLRKGDRLVGNVPGDNYSELPSQSLNAISEVGMISAYYDATGDTDILRLAFEPAVRYLMLFETDGDGVVLPRKGNWEWYDHLYNCDKPILNICWYYSALRFAEKMANELSDNRFDSFINERKSAIEKAFEARYWNTEMNCYASGDFADDRANAMAVLSGLCPKERYENIRYLLMSVFNSTTYMENYVLIALCEMGYKADAIRRMKCRYQPLIENENSTLWEDFFHLGTKNHAWSGGPATVLLRYFAGINGDLTVRETDIAPLKYLKCTFTDKNGKMTVTQK